MIWYEKNPFYPVHMNILKVTIVAILIAIQINAADKKVEGKETQPQIYQAPAKPTVVIAKSGQVGIPCIITATAKDPQDFPICFGFDWNNDGVVDHYSTYIDSGKSITLSNTWKSKGVQTIKIYTRSALGYFSEASVLQVKID